MLLGRKRHVNKFTSISLIQHLKKLLIQTLAAAATLWFCSDTGAWEGRRFGIPEGLASEAGCLYDGVHSQASIELVGTCGVQPRTFRVQPHTSRVRLFESAYLHVLICAVFHSALVHHTEQVKTG